MHMCTSEKNFVVAWDNKSLISQSGSLLYKCKAASGKKIVNHLASFTIVASLKISPFWLITIFILHGRVLARKGLPSLSPTSFCVLNSLNTAHLAVWTSRIILKCWGCLDQCLYKPHSQGTHETLSLIFTKTEGWEKHGCPLCSECTKHFQLLSQEQWPSVVHYEEERIHGSFKFKFFATFLVLLRPWFDIWK